jgi:outer membrane protein assembly factor BamB
MKRNILFFSFFSLFFFAAEAARSQQFSWPQWQGPFRNGLTKETGLVKEWPDGGPKQKWLFDECGAGYAGPAIADGRLFILGERNGVAQLMAIDVESGRELWALDMGGEYRNDWGNGPRSTPTVDGNRVYALDSSGVLICATIDGQEVWRQTMPSLGGKVPNWGYAESPLVDGDKVLCTPGGPQGTIAAFNKETGDPIWRSEELKDFAHYSSIVRGEFHGKPQYVQLLEKRLVGLSVDDGKLLWEVEWPGNVAVIPTPIVRDNHVFVTSGYNAGCMLVSIDANNVATKVYENKVMKNQHGGVINVGTALYGFSDGVGWVSMDIRSGEVNWRERDALGKGAIGYADDRFYCVDEGEGHVVLIDASPQEWKERGRFTLSPQSQHRSPRGGIWVHPVVVNGMLFLRDQEYLYCYDVKQQ